jgi:predicted DNA-binding protein
MASRRPYWLKRGALAKSNLPVIRRATGFETLLGKLRQLYYGIPVLQRVGGNMAMSVRLAPTLETRVAQESRRLGITKSEFVKDALERVYGLRNPADLLSTVRSGKAMRNPQASRNVSARMKAKLRAKLSD